MAGGGGGGIHGRGDMCGRGDAWQGVCMVGACMSAGHAWRGVMCGSGVGQEGMRGGGEQKDVLF